MEFQPGRQPNPRPNPIDDPSDVVWYQNPNGYIVRVPTELTGREWYAAHQKMPPISADFVLDFREYVNNYPTLTLVAICGADFIRPFDPNLPPT